MRVLIIGAGDAGRHIAAKLSELGHDVLLVDESEKALESAGAQLDVLTIKGEGANPRVLEKAEVGRADMVIAVTNRDEVNVLACLYAHAAGVRYTVARVSEREYTSPTSRLDLRQLGVDMVICHKEHSARELFNVLRRPGTLEVVDLLEERLLAVGIRVTKASPLAGMHLRDLGEQPLFSTIRLLSVLRDEKVLVPHGDTRLKVGDHVFVAVQPENVDEFVEWSCPDRIVFEKVVISGGGDLGFRVAQLLESRPLQVVLVEENAERADFCSANLDKALVIHADALDGESLTSAGVIQGTAFVAATGDDEDNIISCMLAKKLGASLAIAKVAKPEYVPIINGLDIVDRVVSPQQAMVNSILHYVRGHNVYAATVLHRLPGEILEIVLPTDSEWVGKAVKDISIPKKSLVAAVLRDQIVHIPTGDFELAAGDRLVVFVLPEAVSKLQSKIAAWRGTN